MGGMSPIAKETAEILESLPAGKAKALLEYARFLAEKTDEKAWDRSFSAARRSGKFRALGSKALADLRSGKARPLDPARM